MKNNHISKAIKAIKKMPYCLMALLLVILPGIAFSQPTPPNGGGTPDTPLSVPFDSRLSILLVVAGILLAVVVIVKAKKNTANKVA